MQRLCGIKKRNDNINNMGASHFLLDKFYFRNKTKTANKKKRTEKTVQLSTFMSKKAYLWHFSGYYIARSMLFSCVQIDVPCFARIVFEAK